VKQVDNEIKNNVSTEDTKKFDCIDLVGNYNEILNEKSTRNSDAIGCSRGIGIHTEVLNRKVAGNNLEIGCLNGTGAHFEILNNKKAGNSKKIGCLSTTGIHVELLNDMKMGDSKAIWCRSHTFGKVELFNIKRSGVIKNYGCLNVIEKQFSFGNYYETKGQSGFSANSNVSSISAFNVSKNKPSLGVCVSVGGKSFLNLDLGTSLQLGIGSGFNIGIPFFGSGGGSGGGSNGDSSDDKSKPKDDSGGGSNGGSSDKNKPDKSGSGGDPSGGGPDGEGDPNEDSSDNKDDVKAPSESCSNDKSKPNKDDSGGGSNGGSSDKNKPDKSGSGGDPSGGGPDGEGDPNEDGSDYKDDVKAPSESCSNDKSKLNKDDSGGDSNGGGSSDKNKPDKSGSGGDPSGGGPDGEGDPNEDGSDNKDDVIAPSESCSDDKSKPNKDDSGGGSNGGDPDDKVGIDDDFSDKTQNEGGYSIEIILGTDCQSAVDAAFMPYNIPYSFLQDQLLFEPRVNSYLEYTTEENILDDTEEKSDSRFGNERDNMHSYSHSNLGIITESYSSSIVNIPSSVFSQSSTQEIQGQDKDNCNKGVSGNGGDLISNNVNDLNTGNHNTKNTAEGNIFENTEKRSNSSLPFNNHSNSIFTESSLSTINNIPSSSFVSNRSSTQKNQNFVDGDLQTGSVTKEENNKTNTSKSNCKVGRVNNNCNENAGFSISDSVEGKDSRKLSAFERALAESISERPHLLAALRRSQSSNSTSNSSNKTKAPDSSTLDNDIREYIKMRAASKRDKQAQENGGNSSSTSGDSKRSTDNNPLSQKESKKDEVQEEDEEDIESPKPCKNHSPSVRCFRCLVGSKGKKVKRVGGNIFGFSN
jgi:hypothetical protein